MVKTRIVPSQPALILEDTQRFLVVTDLHIGFEIGMISNDINVRPESIVEEIHLSLEALIKSEKPDNLILLGDIKSGIDSISDRKSTRLNSSYHSISYDVFSLK